MFYFTCNVSKLYESFTFWNKFFFLLFHDILVFWDVPVCSNQVLVVCEWEWAVFVIWDMMQYRLLKCGLLVNSNIQYSLLALINYFLAYEIKSSVWIVL